MDLYSFRCNGCEKTIVNNSNKNGFHDYVRLNHEVSKGIWKRGMYCDACVNEIKKTRYPSNAMDVLIIRKLKSKDHSKSYKYYTLTKINRTHLKEMISCVKNDFQVAIFYKVNFKKYFKDICSFSTSQSISESISQLTYKEICKRLNVTYDEVVFQQPEEMIQQLRESLYYYSDKDADCWEFFPTLKKEIQQESQQEMQPEDEIIKLKQEIKQNNMYLASCLICSVIGFFIYFSS